MNAVVTKAKRAVIRPYRRLRVTDMELILKLWPETPPRQIARKIGCSERTIHTALKALREAGLDVAPVASMEQMAKFIAQKNGVGSNGSNI